MTLSILAVLQQQKILRKNTEKLQKHFPCPLVSVGIVCFFQFNFEGSFNAPPPPLTDTPSLCCGIANKTRHEQSTVTRRRTATQFHFALPGS